MCSWKARDPQEASRDQRPSDREREARWGALPSKPCSYSVRCCKFGLAGAAQQAHRRGYTASLPIARRTRRFGSLQLADLIPCAPKEHALALLIAGLHPHAGANMRMEAFMPRLASVGLAYSTFMILLSSSAVPQEARAGADAGLGQWTFNNACRPAIRPRKATIAWVRTYTTSSEGKPARCRPSAIPVL